MSWRNAMAHCLGHGMSLNFARFKKTGRLVIDKRCIRTLAEQFRRTFSGSVFDSNSHGSDSVTMSKLSGHDGYILADQRHIKTTPSSPVSLPE